MNDEAVTHYISIIDNMSLGHRFIANTFGAEFVPEIGWQIDPFGHSAWMASAFSDFGFSAEFFSRIDRGDKEKRLREKGMEMIWRGSKSRPIASDIFTHVFYDKYQYV